MWNLVVEQVSVTFERQVAIFSSSTGYVKLADGPLMTLLWRVTPMA